MSESKESGILKKIWLFNDLEPEHIESIAKLLKPVKAKENTAIIKENTKGREIYILIDGQVRVSKFINGKEEAITFLNPGAIFGEMAILGNFERTAEIIAHTDVVMFQIDGKKFVSLLDSNPQMGFKVYRKMAITLAKRLKELDERYHSILSLATMF